MFRPRRRTVAVLASLVAAGGLGWFLSLPTSAGPAVGEGLTGAATRPVGATLRLATLNMDGGEGTDGRVDLARTAKCFQRIDVVALEEVHGFGGDPPTNQAETVGRLLQLPVVFAPAEQRWGHPDFGNALLCDLPVSRWERVVLPSVPLHAKRNYLLATAVWQGRPLNLMVTHVDFKAGGDEQLRRVIARFLELPTPAVLMGDLNHPAKDPQIVKLLATPGVQEAVSSELEPIPGRVDWIFLRGLRAVDAAPVELHASDHPAYWAEVVAVDRQASGR